MFNKKTLLLSVAVVFFIIGVHQSFYFGIQASYWAFMIAGVSFLWIQYMKKQEELAQNNDETLTHNKNKTLRKSKKK